MKEPKISKKTEDVPWVMEWYDVVVEFYEGNEEHCPQVVVRNKKFYDEEQQVVFRIDGKWE